MSLILCYIVFFFFKQKTAYDMRISDWSSDVCSSDLDHRGLHDRRIEQAARQDGEASLGQQRLAIAADHLAVGLANVFQVLGHGAEIGRASCRARVCQYV